MNRTKIALAVGEVARARTTDVAYPFRMGTGYPGDVDRGRPFTIVPRQNNATNPLDVYGNAVLIDGATSTARKVLATDTSVTSIYGIGVRPYPTQQTTGGTTAAFGAAPVNTTQPLDVITDGFVMTKVVGTPQADALAYLWIAASTGSHVQGGFEAADGGVGNTVALTNVRFTGPADASGIVEVRIRAH